MAPHSAEKTPIAMTGTQKDTLPSTNAGTAGEGHAGSAMDKIKAAMGGAPWQVGLGQKTLTLRLHTQLHWVPSHSCLAAIQDMSCSSLAPFFVCL